ncbi:RagB/SusD family nutrient uptake outer membrane protein [Leeuwenhoekiella palythoae]|uniref:RagB/SusD domain-containing protein n=1 Tax=Leeuwenhoekiella palythoae TaxID=573501 RepID=A0A1M5WNI4_9FLAO|nr:RagB/SusD family nutrient uptake outer membrane protein [Leeuwenhoekiella palythoae]RXG31448.1 RagB/SusD domain-containing protein [Leeuwenhoekiella palythoae]SHH89051.1 RagB/SusD domain-containing protein [Leeuwenhoekiella palythoae]
MNYRIFTLVLGLSALLFSSCTDLEEEILDESLTGTDGLAEPVTGSISAAYGILPQTFRHTRYFGLQEIPSDEAILPPRTGLGGTQWADNDTYTTAHRHLMSSSNSLVTESWSYLTTALFRTVAAIDVLTPLAEAGDAEAIQGLAEMRALRAYENMLFLDSWGLTFRKEATSETSEVLRGAEAVTYIEEEFLAALENLSTTNGPGRMTQDAVYGFLAKLYLNAGVYRDPYGTPVFTDEDMANVVSYTDRIINNGSYALSPEYFDLFNDENHDNAELIFALDLRGVLNNDHNRWAYWSMSGSLFPRPGDFYLSMDGTDGPAATPEFYQNWVDAYGNVDPADADARFYQKNAQVPAELEDISDLTPYSKDTLGLSTDKDHYFIAGEDFEIDRGIIRGTMWAPRKENFRSGSFMTGTDGNGNSGFRIYPLAEARENGSDPEDIVYYVDHTLDISLDGSAGYASGYRFAKWQFSKTSDDGNNYSNVDLVLLRLADVYLMRAEAKLRMGDAAGALTDVNTVRTSRNARPEQTPAALTQITLPTLLRERGFEFYWEMSRRSDQIRFGTYEDSWTSKTDSDVHHRLFPIPQEAIDGASNTPGYLEQNAGY